MELCTLRWKLVQLVFSIRRYVYEYRYSLLSFENTFPFGKMFTFSISDEFFGVRIVFCDEIFIDQNFSLFEEKMFFAAAERNLRIRGHLCILLASFWIYSKVVLGNMSLLRKND